MKKALQILAMTGLITMAMGMTAFAGQWRQDGTGWWYDNGNGTWPANTWQWIDGNQDGVAECYYFDSFGYMAANTITPDGYTVDVNGAWTINGAVQTQAMAPNYISGIWSGYYVITGYTTTYTFHEDGTVDYSIVDSYYGRNESGTANYTLDGNHIIIEKTDGMNFYVAYNGRMELKEDGNIEAIDYTEEGETSVIFTRQ